MEEHFAVPTDSIVDLVYVDDDLIYCQLVSKVIGKTTLQCRCFENPDDAIVFLQTHQTRTLITDYRMPKLNGIDFIRQARDLISTANVFIASASHLPDDAEDEAEMLNATPLLKDRFIQPGYIESLCDQAA